MWTTRVFSYQFRTEKGFLNLNYFRLRCAMRRTLRAVISHSWRSQPRSMLGSAILRQVGFVLMLTCRRGRGAWETSRLTYPPPALKFLKQVNRKLVVSMRLFRKIRQKQQIQLDLVIRGLFICEFAYSLLNIGVKGQISCQNMSFYMRIQYLRSKIAGRIYCE